MSLNKQIKNIGLMYGRRQAKNGTRVKLKHEKNKKKK